MWAPTKIQCGIFATASGVVIESLSVAPFYATYWHSWFGMYYQLLVGAVMMVVGFCTGSICFEELSFLPKVVYLLSGAVLFFPGVYVFTNMERYDLVFSHLGSWPIHAIGLLTTFDGAITLGYALTVYQPPPPA